MPLLLMAEEYYIRQPDSETAKGPYNVDKLITLAEAGQLTRETLYYDDDLESWAAVGSNEELKQLIFPERRRLSLRKKSTEELNLLTGEDEEDDAVKVSDILAAAEGRTEDTKHLGSTQDWRRRVAGMSTNLIGLCLLATAVAVLLGEFRFFQGLYNYYVGLVSAPAAAPATAPAAGAEAVAPVFPTFTTAVVVAFIDLLLGLAVLSGMVSTYPLVRMRSMFLLGYFAMVYGAGYLAGDISNQWMLLAVIGSTVGLFVATLATDVIVFLIAAVIALIGTGYYAYLQGSVSWAAFQAANEAAKTALLFLGRGLG